MCYLGTWIRGRLPRTGMAAPVIEVAPGLDIEPLTDVARQAHRGCRPGILVVERQFGYLEFHSRSTAAVRSASAAVLEALGASPARGDAGRSPRLDARLAPRPPARVPHQPQQARLDGAARRVAVRARDAAGVVRDPRRQRGREGGAHQGRRLPHDRRHRPRLPHRRGVRRARGRPRRRPGRWRRSHERASARQILRELLAEALAGRNGNGVVPQVPAPPVAAVLRPSTWTGPPAGAEVIGGGGVPDADAQHVPIGLRRRPRPLRAASAARPAPGEREAIRAGRLRFTLGAPQAPVRRGDRPAPSGSSAARSPSARSTRPAAGRRAARARAARGPDAPGARQGARARGSRSNGRR